MTPKFGPLGFVPDDRYRQIAEERIIAMLIFAGWPFEPAAGDAARQALETWIEGGVGFRRAANGERLFDPVEVYNHMKQAGIEERDGFFFENFSATRRRFIADFAALISHGEDHRFTVDFQRTFHLHAVTPGSKLRLRMPLPLTGDHLTDLQVTPLTENASVAAGRLEARLVASDQKNVTMGARLSFTASRQEPESHPEAMLADSTLYLAEREGLIVVTDRIKALAKSLAGDGTPPMESIRAFWEHIHTTLACGMIHYDQIDLAAPCDWVLDAGWFDCQLASALFVALCRARGIPARLAGGHFLYPAAPTNHFWAEAWIDGQGWTPFDFFGWDISNGGRLHDWRDRFFARLEPRLVTERLPREFTGAVGVPIPRAWCLLQTPVPGGVEISLLNIDGTPVHTEIVRVTA